MSVPSTSRSKKIFKIVLGTAAGFVVLFGLALGAAAILVPKFFPPEKIKKMVTEELSKKLGRTIKVKDVSFNVLQGFRLTGLSMSNRAGWTSGPFLAADEVKADYRLLPILWGRILLSEVKLEKPVLLVERQGPTNYNFSDLGKTTGAAPAASSTSSTASIKVMQMLEIGKVTIHQARITYIDHLAKPALKVEMPGLDLTVKNVSLAGGKTTLKLGTPILYGGTTYRLDADGAFRLNLPNQNLKSVKMKGSFSGVAFDVAGEAKDLIDDFSPDMKGKASLDLSKALALAPKSAGPLPKDLSMSGVVEVPFKLDGSLKKGLGLGGEADLSACELAFGSMFKKAKGVKCALSFNAKMGEDWVKVSSFEGALAGWSAKGSLSLTGLEVYPGDPKARPAFALSLSAPSLPLKELSGLSPFLKDFTFTGEIAVDVAASASFKDVKSGSLKGVVDFKGLNAVHAKEPHFVEGFTGKVTMTDTSIQLPSMKFKLIDSPTVVSFSMTRFRLGELMDFSKCNALVTGSLTASDIDLEKVMACLPVQPKDGKAAAPSAAAKTPPPDLRSTVSPGLSVNLQAVVKSFFYRKIQLKDASASLTLAKRVLKTTSSIGAFSGKGTTAFGADLGRFPIPYTFSLDLANVQAQAAINETVDSFVKKNPENYKDKVHGTMNFRMAGTGLLDAAPDKSIKGNGPVSITGVRVQGLALLGGLFKNLKDKKNEMKLDRLDGTIQLIDGKAVLALKADGTQGRTRVNGAIGFNGNYAPELRIENDIRKESLDVDTYFASVPQSLRSKLDVNRAADAQGFVPIDFKLTGAVSEAPGAKALDLTRLTKNVTASYTRGVQQKAVGAAQKASEAVGSKLKGLFGK